VIKSSKTGNNLATRRHLEVPTYEGNLPKTEYKANSETGIGWEESNSETGVGWEESNSETGITRV